MTVAFGIKADLYREWSQWSGVSVTSILVDLSVYLGLWFGSG